MDEAVIVIQFIRSRLEKDPDTYEVQVEEPKHTIQTEECRHFLHMMISAYNKKECAAFHSRRKSNTGESPTSFPDENTNMTCPGFEPEPTRLQAEGHIRRTGWVAN
ncbi:hypothetical protein TNCV_1456111 [Trichonephila clavipes]|nr:hypothetical protein TNCV_1456111 [Trichonephila clavipes]